MGHFHIAARFERYASWFPLYYLYYRCQPDYFRSPRGFELYEYLRIHIEKNIEKAKIAVNLRSAYRISRIVTIASLPHAEIEVCLETGPNSSAS